MTSLATRLDAVRAALDEAARAAGRAPESVRLVAVSKKHPTAVIREAHALGQRAFGENYLQEALAKQAELAGLDCEWHFIGAVQSNKTAEIATAFDWVHTVDRAKIARRLNDQRPDDRPPLNVLLQVNISGEMSKNGVTPAAAAELAALFEHMPRLQLRGLMALPAPSEDPSLQREAFAELRRLAATLPGGLDELSIGTTQDYRAAIAEGATLVRLGTAVFGPRPEAP